MQPNAVYEALEYFGYTAEFLVFDDADDCDEFCAGFPSSVVPPSLNLPVFVAPLALARLTCSSGAP